MSAIQWARRVRCDWPGCQSEGDVTLGKDWPYTAMPEGWLSLSPALTLIRADGRSVNDLCSIHASADVGALVRVFAQEKAAT